MLAVTHPDHVTLEDSVVSQKPLLEHEFDQEPLSSKEADFLAAKHTTSSDTQVYAWYFKHVGGANFIIFLFFCSLFVLGTIYPRMYLPCVFIEGCLPATLTLGRGLGPRMDAKRPRGSASDRTVVLWHLLWSGKYGMDGIRSRMPVPIPTYGSSWSNYISPIAGENDAKVRVIHILSDTTSKRLPAHLCNSSPRPKLVSLSTGT